MQNQIIAILVFISFIVVFSPIYLLPRKMWQMADDDLKKIDYQDWRKQTKFNAYHKLISRLIWGLFLLSGFIINFQKVVAVGFNWFSVFVLVLGFSFIVWGILGFRIEMKNANKIR